MMRYHAAEQYRQRRDRPWLLVSNDPFNDDLLRQQIGPHRTSTKLLQAQTIYDTKRWDILFEGLSAGYFSAF
jgi:hypothetical protein